MKGPLLGIIVVLALLGMAAIFYAGPALAPEQIPPVEQLYSNGVYGISFSYPVGYLLSEEDMTGPNDPHHYVITLIREEDAVPVVAGGEGPTAITIDIYSKGESEDMPAWLRAHPESNFALGDGTLADMSVGGAHASRYSWSGLYEGETTAFFHNNWTILVSVTFMSSADQMRADYEYLLDSFRLR